ncbi:MAG TPA: hypothetical protein QF764_03025 [Planctomycetota bacterium]|nr:hypothetical protein [Planctomycetota bacterium]
MALSRPDRHRPALETLRRGPPRRRPGTRQIAGLAGVPLALWTCLILLPSPPNPGVRNQFAPLPAVAPRAAPLEALAAPTRIARPHEPAAEARGRDVGAGVDPHAADAGPGDLATLAAGLAVGNERTQRFLAIKHLREFATPEAAEALRACALGPGEVLVRSAALHGYHAIAGAEAVDGLRQVLQRTDQRDLHRAVLGLLGKTRGRPAREALLAHVPAPGDGPEWLALARGLSHHGRESAPRVSRRLAELCAGAPPGLDLEAALEAAPPWRGPAHRGPRFFDS